MSTSQPPKCYLLRIPRELRDAIYAYYLSDDGYYHQPESNTLRHADRSAIDLALTLSCKQVAAEMIALPLKLNAVEFRTHLAPIETAGIGERKWLFRKPPPRDRHSDDYSAPPSRAGHFHFLLARLHDKEADACVIAFNAYGTEELAKCISERFPQSCLGKQLQKPLPNKVTEASYYEVMDRFRNSTFYERQAMQFLLENISAFATQANIVNESNHKSENEFKLPLGPMSRHASEVVASRISSVEWPPWVLPTALHISKLHEIVNSVDKSDPEHGYCSNAHKLRYYESAASQCIRFLGMLEQDASFRLRHLIIREDRRSCTKPRCHAYGLIPYLRGLPHLRVDHHVDMWHVIFTTDYSGLARLGLDLRSWPDPRFIPWLSNAVDETATWIKEAMHLRRAGMPPSAYRLHLEAPVETVEDVWGIIKSRAALHHLTSHLPVRNKYRSFRCDDDFVSCVRLILCGDSTVHLPCPIGTLEEFEEEIGRISEDLNSLPRNLWEDYGIDLVERALDTSMVDVKAIYELYTDSPA